MTNSKQPLGQYSLAQLGWDRDRQAEFDRIGDTALFPVRVASAVRGRYRVLGLEGQSAQLAICRKRLAEGDDDLLAYPAVGDWALARRDHDAVVIEHILSRRSCFVRKTAGRDARPQMIASNVDRVLIVTAVDRDFNPRRLERYLATVWSGGAEPVIVVNKTDLPHDPAGLETELGEVALGTRVVTCCAHEDDGLEDLIWVCETGKTIAFVGSSGVGKSTIINRLIGAERQATAPVRDSDRKGRHTTSGQELLVTSGGFILIDTPGLRELGLWDAAEGVGQSFSDIEELARGCRFRDCNHTGEPGCAVESAVSEGSLKRDRLDSYLRLRREIEYTKERAATRSGGNTKSRWKHISKWARQAHRLKQDRGMKGK